VLSRFLRWAVVVAVACIPVAMASSSGAQTADQAPPTETTPGIDAGPTITPSTVTIEPGQRIEVTFDGWDARLATLMVCGNAARRGSGDCDQVHSQGVTLRGVGLSGDLASMVIYAPQLTCPCALRAIGVDTHETALVPIDIVGHPGGPVVDAPGGTLIDMSVSAERADAGVSDAVRSWLGGPVAYDVTVEVVNLTLSRLDDVVVYGSAGRSGGKDVAGFAMKPGPIEGGRTWSGVVRVELPAPTIGAYDWHATASGAGPVVNASSSSKQVPWLLFVVIALLVGDLIFVVVRFLKRRRANQVRDVPPPHDPDGLDRADPAPEVSDDLSELAASTP